MNATRSNSKDTASLPDFIVIGAMKAGTTSLQEYLDVHPEIAMAPKSLSFFCDGENWHRGLDWYQSHFGNHDRMQGEVSPKYSKTHAYPEIPAKIHAILPRVKLIYVVREPTERIVSHFSHAIGADFTGRSPDAILEQSLDHYVATSKYHMHLEEYLRHFDKNQILIVTTEKLRDERIDTLKRIFRFIGVDDSFSSTSFDLVRHDSSVKVKRNRLGRLVARYPSLRVIETGAKKLVPHSLHSNFARLLGSSFDKPVLNQEMRERISEILGDETDRLRALTGYSFDEWQR